MNYEIPGKIINKITLFEFPRERKDEIVFAASFFSATQRYFIFSSNRLFKVLKFLRKTNEILFRIIHTICLYFDLIDIYGRRVTFNGSTFVRDG